MRFPVPRVLRTRALVKQEEVVQGTRKVRWTCTAVLTAFDFIFCFDKILAFTFSFFVGFQFGRSLNVLFHHTLEVVTQETEV